MLNQLPFWQGRYEENSNIARAKNDKPWVEEASVLLGGDLYVFVWTCDGGAYSP